MAADFRTKQSIRKIGVLCILLFLLWIAIRYESGLTDKEIGDYLNLSVQSVNKWRHGRGLPDIENLFLLSGIFNLRVDDFLVPITNPANESDPKPEANTRAISRFCRINAYYDGIRMILNHPLNDNAA